MKNRFLRLSTLLVLLTLVIGGGFSVRAQEPTTNKSSFDKSPLNFESTSAPEGSIGGPLAQAQGNGKVKLVVELKADPAVVVYANQLKRGNKGSAVNATQAQLASINQTQGRVVNSLQAMDAKVIYRTQRVLNSIAIIVDAKRIPEIYRLADVKSIKPLVSKSIDHTTSVPLIGAPELWSASGLEISGEGMTIGIIDTGIDYGHANFGGPGTVAAYNSNDSTVITDTAMFPTMKVVGGYDFAGDDYDARFDATSIPAPDPDPLDCNGHGSHVAGTAAGYGVNSDGTTYTDGYSDTLDFDSFKIGPGVAPHADLYALKVFGCDGSTDVTDAAIEWSVDPNGDGDFTDHLDVINMSLGSDFGGLDDSSAIASDNAALAGVVVVASAGNSGDTHYITGSPGSAKRVISTASSVDSGSILDGFKVSGATGNPALNKVSGATGDPALNNVHPASNSVAYPWFDPTVTVLPTTTLPLTATLYYPPAGERTGCTPFSTATKAAIAGKIVLLDWTEPSCGGSVARTRNVRLAGGVGAFIADTAGVFDLRITGDPIIPAQSISYEIGVALKEELAVNPNLKVTFDRKYNNAIKFIDEGLEDTLSDFSSRGPRRVDSMLKPDIAAPGQSIFSTAVGTGNDGASINGTSMAAPHIAGSMALLRELHPSWSVEELKALAMNTATNDIRTTVPLTSTVYGPARQGAGRVDLPNAVEANVIAYSQDSGAVSVSFGEIEVLNSYTAVKNILVTNKGTSSATFSVSYDSYTDIPGVSYAVSPASITVPAGGLSFVQVTITANASAMEKEVDPSLDLDQDGTGLGRNTIAEESGYVLLNSSTATNIRVPVYATLRPASLMTATPTSLSLGTVQTATASLDLSGKELDSATYTSLVSALELQHVSPDDTWSMNSANGADLQYVGMMSDVSTTDFFTETWLYLGVATQGDWSTINETEFDVYFDTNKDGVDDYVAFNWNYAQATGGTDASDFAVVVVQNLKTGARSVSTFVNYVEPATEIDTYPFNNNVAVLPIPARRLGITNAGSAGFNYQVVTFHRDFTGAVDATPYMYYNAAQPGMDTTSGFFGPLHLDLNSTNIPVRYNRTWSSNSNGLGILLLHHHNIEGRRAEVIMANYVRQEYKIFLPLILK